MTPFEKIEAAYLRHPQQESFFTYLLQYHRTGFVFSRPDFFVMGRPVPRYAEPSRIFNNGDLFHGEVCDCWYVMAAAGNISPMWRILPWPLPWICWTRPQVNCSRLTFIKTERLIEICPPDLTEVDETL